MTTARRGTTRDRIVHAATGMFRRRGIQGSGVSEICERAGVTKGVFSYHFPGGKDELVVDVIRRNGDDVRKLLDVVERGDAPPMVDLVSGAFTGYAALLRELGTDFGCPVAASVVDSSHDSPTARSAAAAAFRSWAEVIQRSARGEDDLGVLVVAALEGGILLARAEGDPEVLDRVGAALVALVADPEGDSPL